MKLISLNANCQFVVDDQGVAHCFSYDQEVAVILDDNTYLEYETPPEFATAHNGKDLYNSATTRKHKAAFRRYFEVTK